MQELAKLRHIFQQVVDWNVPYVKGSSRWGFPFVDKCTYTGVGMVVQDKGLYSADARIECSNPPLIHGRTLIAVGVLCDEIKSLATGSATTPSENARACFEFDLTSCHGEGKPDSLIPPGFQEAKPASNYA